jgi:hypothetical protein
LGASLGEQIGRDAIGSGTLGGDEAHLLKQFLQRELDFLLAGEGAAVAKDIGADGSEALEGDADAAPGDFFRQFIDGEVDPGHRIVRSGPEEMSGDPGQNIAEAKDNFLLLFARFWSGFRIAGGGHVQGILTNAVKRAKL